MSKFILILTLCLSTISFAQVELLKPEFRNLSWIMNSKSAEIVSTLSYHFGDDSLSNQVVSSWYDYNMYYDSLSLWYITKDSQGSDSTSKATIQIDTEVVGQELSNSYWLNKFRHNTDSTYKNKGITHLYCVPSSYENLKWFESTYPQYIKSYNQGRIKSWEYTQRANKKLILKYYLVFHSKIEPTNNYGYKSGLGPWVPYFYEYQKPNVHIDKPTNKLIWESKTGLPYNIIEELGLSEDRVPKILRLLGDSNDDLLIAPEITAGGYKDIYVSCDTCDYTIYDNAAQDGDIVDVTHKGGTQRINILNKGTTKKVIVGDGTSLKLLAISEGYQIPCTIFFKIESQDYVFKLRENESILINLKPKK